MRLRAWREGVGKSQSEVGRLVGTANATVVSRWERGVHLPRRDEMRRIYILSCGAVTPNDFYDLPVLEAPAAEAA